MIISGVIVTDLVISAAAAGALGVCKLYTTVTE